MKLHHVAFASLACMALVAERARADAVDSLRMAIDLAATLAAEKPCGLTFDQTAVAQWVADHVSPNDMSFITNLDIFLSTKTADFRTLAPSQKTVVCTQSARIARSYNFIK